MGLDVNGVLAVCIGIGLAVLFFLPIAAAFRVFVQGSITRNHPALLKVVPDFIWILGLGLVGGILFRLLLLLLLGGVPPNLLDVVKGASALTDLGIVFVVMIAGASQSGHNLRQFAHNVRILMWPATIGAAGVLLGSTVVAYALKPVLLNLPDGSALWESVWKGAVANANGWIGDSTTFYPTLSILDMSRNGTGSFGTPAILLDTLCGLLWLGLATHMVSKYSVKDSESNPVIAQPTPDTGSEKRRSVGAVIVFCLAGGVAAIFLRILAEVDDLRESRWRPLMAIGIYILAFIAGYLFARWDSRVASKPARGQILLFAIGLIGMKSGLTLGLLSVRTLPLAFMYLSIIAVGAFAGHILLLRLFGGSSWGLLFVASMCSIGGLATAPLIAGQYSDDLIEPSYAVALWCNLLSISSLLMIGVLSPT
jgi:hypothetical protein